MSGSALGRELEPYVYRWPRPESLSSAAWSPVSGHPFRGRRMPEHAEELATDSRWPALFPSSICLVTTAVGGRAGLEKVVGASIVNRFPYVMALSFCNEPLSARHHVRRTFTSLFETAGSVAVQWLHPGSARDRVLDVIQSIPEQRTDERLRATGLATRRASTSDAPVFEEAYLVYEGRFVRPGRDFSGRLVNETHARDVGSHRVFFVEITAIQLDADISKGSRAIRWRSLPAWRPERAGAQDRRVAADERGAVLAGLPYRKTYTPDYVFPSPATVAFEADEWIGRMAVKYLPPLPEDQVEVDNNRARWPCFFPSSVGVITSWSRDRQASAFPCGSTTIVSRHPLVVAPCVSYSPINERYAPRASLEPIIENGRFGCGVPFIDPTVLTAISYLGNVSYRQDAAKLANSGLHVRDIGHTPVIDELPIHFDCRVIDRVYLGTHVMFLGEVERILLRDDLSAANPIEWCPWPRTAPA